MAGPYNVASRDEQRSGFVTNRSTCDSFDGLALDFVCGFTKGEGEGGAWFQAWAEKYLKTAFFWVITQQAVVITDVSGQPKGC